MSKGRSARTAQSVNNSGFSGQSKAGGARLINKDGSANLRKTGMPFYMRLSIYHSLLKMHQGKFLFMVFASYTIMNLLFASIYMLIGIDKLSGSAVQNNWFDNFSQAFFFSSQTLTTVGYGHIAPIGLLANTIASIESFLGIMTFALVTGMFYARFSRPKAYIKFSHNFLVAPYKDGKAIMFRMATYKNNELTDVEANITAAFHEWENGNRVTKFYPLKLEIARINSLAISWTCVHNLDEDSPFWHLTEKDMMEGDIEMMVTVKGFDDHFSNMVQQRTSYATPELVYGAKFVPMSQRGKDDNGTEVMLHKLNEFEPYSLH